MNAEPLWTDGTAALATGGTACGSWAATGVAIDSRSIMPGDLYVALRGPNFDGHDFVTSALASGAAAAMVRQASPQVADTAPLLLVPDTMNGLEKLAIAARARSAAKVIAVTGSVGKTGTKDALAQVLGLQGETIASVGNLNNHIGVPLSLARLPPSAKFAVFELGMNHAGEISPLARLVRPDVAIITTVTSAHLEFFADEAAIADEKATIMDGLAEDGTVILPRDSPHFERLADYAKARGIRNIVSFGSHHLADIELIVSELEYGAHEIVALLDGRKLAYRLGMHGRHWALNSLAVLAAVVAVGGDVAQAAAALASVVPPKGRGQISEITVGTLEITLIDDSYNASPAAVRAALATLAMMTPDNKGRLIAVLGDMLELGPNAPALHAELADAVNGQDINLVFSCGPLMRHLHDTLPPHRRGGHKPDSASLIPLLRENLRNGDIVLVKGSLGSRMGLIVKDLMGEPG
jgi:UDP-N-acetylmuramoyl-tripeptide--D-alanyl-D-alanine ligase